MDRLVTLPMAFQIYIHYFNPFSRLFHSNNISLLLSEAKKMLVTTCNAEFIGTTCFQVSFSRPFSLFLSPSPSLSLSLALSLSLSRSLTGVLVHANLQPTSSCIAVMGDTLHYTALRCAALRCIPHALVTLNRPRPCHQNVYRKQKVVAKRDCGLC